MTAATRERRLEVALREPARVDWRSLRCLSYLAEQLALRAEEELPRAAEEGADWIGWLLLRLGKDAGRTRCHIALPRLAN